MSNNSDQQRGSINLDFSVDPKFAHRSSTSSLTAPLLEVVEDYEVVSGVPGDVPTEPSSELVKLEHKFTGNIYYIDTCF